MKDRNSTNGRRHLDQAGGRMITGHHRPACMPQHPPPPAADALKARALQKLAQAHALVLSAREDLCNLEGPGYCLSYEQALDVAEQIQRHAHNLRTLRPPTGVFTV